MPKQQAMCIQLYIATEHGTTRAYVLHQDEETLQWSWLADTEFGPFDTRLDVFQWVWKAIRDVMPVVFAR